MVIAGCGGRTSLFDDLGEPASDASVDAARTDASRADAAHDAAPACVPARPDAGACNALLPTGGPIAVVCDPSPPPTPIGGVVADGTYVLVSSTFHGPCTLPESDRITWSVCGSAWSTVQESTLAGNTTTQHIDGEATLRGTSLGLQTSCGTSVSSTAFDFDATPTTLTLYVHGFGPGTVRVDAFVRR
jgi:hypothetical protein